jgi:two-component system response regulator AtoC
MPLVRHFVGKHVKGGFERLLPKGAEDALLRHSWPGNVRELENVIERAVILSHGRELNFEDWPRSTPRNGSGFSLQLPGEEVSIKRALAQVVPQVESELIRRALKLTSNNRTRAAKLLEISHRSLLYKLKSYNCG